MNITYEQQFIRDLATARAVRKAELSPVPRKRSFAASKTPDTLSAWTTVMRSIDSDIKASRKQLIARSREQALNNDYIKRYLDMNVQNVMGHNGIKFKSKVMLADGTTPDTAARNLLQNSWLRWGKYGIPTIDGMMSWLDVEKLVARQTPRDGGILIRHIIGFPNGWGYAIQILGVDYIDTDMDNIKTPEGNIIRMGVEKTPFGRPVAFYLFTNNLGDEAFFINSTGRRSVRVPAEELDYIFLPQSDNQTHGYPWVHSALISLKHMGLYREAEVIMARLGAQKNVYYTRDTEAPAASNSLITDEESDGQRIETIVEPGENQELPAGYDVKSIDPTHPNSNYPEFESAILKGAASGLNVSSVSLSNDLTKVNFSSIRSGVLDERNAWRVIQQFYIQRVHERVFLRWLPMALITDLAGQLRFSDINRLIVSAWRARGWDWVDPQKDMTANEKAINMGLKSRQEITAERGRDWDEVLEEIKEEEEAARLAGVDINKTISATETVVIENEEGEEINAN